MYKNEQIFSRQLTVKLQNCGMNIQRIESHDTGNGIPDMFVQGYGLDFWLELKHLDVDASSKQYKINWRPGQQAWHNNYYMFHARKKCVLTVVDMNDGVMIIPMTRIFPNNVVYDPLIVLDNDWHKLNIARLFVMLSNPVIPKDETVTLRYLLNDYADKYYKFLPDTDVLDSMEIEQQELDQPPASLKRLQKTVFMLWDVLENVKLNTL